MDGTQKSNMAVRSWAKEFKKDVNNMAFLWRKQLRETTKKEEDRYNDIKRHSMEQKVIKRSLTRQ
jgi:hypothetical protein